MEHFLPKQILKVIIIIIYRNTGRKVSRIISLVRRKLTAVVTYLHANGSLLGWRAAVPDYWAEN